MSQYPTPMYNSFNDDNLQISSGNLQGTSSLLSALGQVELFVVKISPLSDMFKLYTKRETNVTATLVAEKVTSSEYESRTA